MEKKIDPAKFDEMARNIGKNQDDIKDLVHDAANHEDEINKLKQNVKLLEDKVKSMEEADSGINHENLVKEISARVIEETRRTQKSNLEEHRKNAVKEKNNYPKPTFVEIIEKNQGAIQKANQQLKENVSRIRERINSQVENKEKNDLNIDANKSSYRNVNSNPQESQISTRSSNINEEFNDNKEILTKMFKEAENRIGIFPVTFEDVRDLANRNCHPNIDSDSPSMFEKSQEYHNARMSVGYDFCQSVLHIPSHMINIFDANFCKFPKDRILWLKVTKDFAQQMFMAAAREKNDKISVIQWIPPPAIERKRELVKILKEFREMEPSLRTQIRIGKTDLKVVAKHFKKGEFTPFIDVEMKIIDPLRKLPAINVKGKEIDPRDEEYFKEKIKILKKKKEEDSNKNDKASNDGFNEVRNKRKTRSPVKENDAKRINSNNSPQKRLTNLNNYLKGIRNEPAVIVMTDDESESEDDLNETNATIIESNPLRINTSDQTIDAAANLEIMNINLTPRNVQEDAKENTETEPKDMSNNKEDCKTKENHNKEVTDNLNPETDTRKNVSDENKK